MTAFTSWENLAASGALGDQIATTSGPPVATVRRKLL
jgi:hypothetical protein